MKGNQIDGQPVTEEQLLKEGYRKYTGEELISFIIKIFVNILVIVFVEIQKSLKLVGNHGLFQITEVLKMT